MAEIETRNFSDEEWEEHVLRAQTSNGSERSYCKENGLSMYLFGVHKKRLGLTQSRSSTRKPKRFVRAEIQPDPRREVSPLPDAGWVADVLRRISEKR